MGAIVPLHYVLMTVFIIENLENLGHHCTILRPILKKKHTLNRLLFSLSEIVKKKNCEIVTLSY